MPSRNAWITLGTTLGVVGVTGGMLYLSRSASAAAPRDDAEKNGTGERQNGDSDKDGGPLSPDNLPALPTAGDVEGDLSRNWGSTPPDLRPLFLLMEETSKIVGSGRIFALIAYREARFITTAHNGDDPSESAERDGSRRAYENNKERNPPLPYGEESADFGSGGLFGLLAPYFLWAGVPEVGKRAPFLNARPELMFEPRIAGFAAALYMHRLLKYRRIDDHADIKVGWANPSLLSKGRGGDKYQEIRARFFDDADKLGLDLEDEATIPGPRLDSSGWPGFDAVFKGIVGLSRTEVA